MNNQLKHDKSSLIYLVFFLSGASALIYEGLWFHLAGLIVGNSIIAAATVLSGFMAGLALGNFLVTKYERYIKNTIELYLILELIIGTAGFTSIIIMPLLPGLTAPLLQQFHEFEYGLTLIRFCIVFTILFVPTTAMGMTLPILVKELCKYHNKKFGHGLGQLYGWNTIGAVIGILISEFYLINWFGIQRTGFLAVSFNFIIVLIIYNQFSLDNLSNIHIELDKPVLNKSIYRLLLASFLSGAILLGLEIIWFRFLLLVVIPTSESFAIMLACVLTGIGLGGFLGGILYKYKFPVDNYLREMFYICVITCIITYLCFSDVFNLTGELLSRSGLNFIFNAMVLILPNSILSGVIFTAIGKAIYNEQKHEINTTGLVTLTNTIGAMIGSLISSFILLPFLGMEKSFWLMGVLYFLLSFIVPLKPDRTVHESLFYLRPALILISLAIIITFPFGHLYKKHYMKLAKAWNAASIVEIKEGLAATNMYFQYDKYDHPYYYRLMSNSHSMSATDFRAERYMKLFAYLPGIMHLNLKDALLISYGVGNTAKALTNLEQIRSIDVVDISKDVLKMSDILFSNEEHPLNDSRVDTIIEDGRFYLLTSDKSYDLITGEPPPPLSHKIVNLYTQEYFELIFNRLNDGGITTYWLPAYQLNQESTKSIIKAFCNVFANCTLWRSYFLDWMLVGVKGKNKPVNYKSFQKFWDNPKISKDLIKIGLEKSEQFSAMFLADADQLSELTRFSKSLLDNYPKRISKRLSIKENAVFFSQIMDEDISRSRFLDSKYINNFWSHELIQKSLKYFDYQRIFRNIAKPNASKPDEFYLQDLYKILTDADLVTLPLLLLGSDYKEQEIVRKALNKKNIDNRINLSLAIKYISERNYDQAGILLRKYIDNSKEETNREIYSLYFLIQCLRDKPIELDSLEHTYNLICPGNKPVI